MAIQLNTKYRGRMGNIICYERHGDFLMRTVPKQTANSIRTASAFGKAASNAKNLRTVLSPIIPCPKDKSMQNRLTAAMRLFFAAAPNEGTPEASQNPLTGFRFLVDSSIADYLLFPLSISEWQAGKISVGIPAIKPSEAIAAPAGTESVHIMLNAGAIHPETGEIFNGEIQLIEIPFSEDLQNARSFDLDCLAEPGSIAFVGAALSFRKAGQRITQPNLVAAEILAAALGTK